MGNRSLNIEVIGIPEEEKKMEKRKLLKKNSLHKIMKGFIEKQKCQTREKRKNPDLCTLE